MNATPLDEARMQPAVAWAAFRSVLANPEDTPRVFELIRAMAGPSLRRGLWRFRNTTFGKRALVRRPRLLSHLQDKEALAALPAGSLGRAYFGFVYGEHLSAEELVAAASEADAGYAFADADLRWFRERVRDQHDLWHTLTQYGRDPFGEACLLAFTYAQMRNRGVGLLVLGAAWKLSKVMGWRVFAALWQGFQAGRHANWLPAEDWERNLALPVDELRRLLAIGPPSVYWEVKADAADNARYGASDRPSSTTVQPSAEAAPEERQAVV